MTSYAKPAKPANEATHLLASVNEEKRAADSSWTDRLFATAGLVVTSGTGLLADGYDLLVIDLVIADISHLHPGLMGPKQKSFAVSMTLLGVVLGQLSFGAVADALGRRAAALTTSSLIAVGALLSACCFHSENFPLAMQLGVCRLFLGIGIGGEYPVSASLCLEGHAAQSGGAGVRPLGSRPQVQTLVSGMFNLGSVFTAVVVLVLLHAGVRPEGVWRTALALGAVPALVAFAARTRQPVAEPLARAPPGAPGSSQGNHAGYVDRLSQAIGPRKMILLGACLSWAVFNFTMYGQSSFRSTINDRIYGVDSHESVRHKVHRNAIFSLTMSISACVGTTVGVILVDGLSRFHLQLLGFLGTAVAMWFCGGLLGTLPGDVDWPLVVLNYLWVVLYTQVGITTFLISAEYFPATARATCFGIAAASGKVGAILGTSLFPVCEARYGLQIVLITSGFVSLVGIVVTWLFTPREPAAPGQLDGAPGRDDHLPASSKI